MTTTPSQGVRNVPVPGSYALDQSHSHVSFSARHLMVTKVRGRFPVTEGKLVIDEDPTKSYVEAVIDVRAGDSGDPKRDEHLRSADFFDVEQFPELKFESTGVEQLDEDTFRITGKLTIHGVTNDVVLHAEVDGTDVDPWGNERVGLEVIGELSRGDYGMKFNQALGSGNMLVADKVKLALDISAVKQS
jgi:polyisoprenoid-binding protein YceI